MGTRTTLAASLLAAAALAGGYALRPGGEPVCELHTVFGPAGDLATLAGAEHVPAAEPDETVGAVLALRILPGDEAGPALDPAWIQPPGLVKSPVDCGAYEWPEERVLVVPVATMHPESIVGLVARDGAEDRPEEPAHLGYCYGPGCRCAAEPCEHVAIGAVDRCYWSHRLHRLIPDAPYTDDCPGPPGPEEP